MSWIRLKLNSNLEHNYNVFLSEFNCSNLTVFHSYHWLKAFNADVEFWYFKNQENVVKSIFIFIETKKYFVTGLHIPPYTQYFSPLFADSTNEIQKKEIVFALINKLSLENKLHVLDFKLFRGNHDILPFHWLGFQTTINLTYTVSGSYSEYFSKLNKNKVREIKKLYKLIEEEKIEIVTEIEDKEVLELFEITAQRAEFSYSPIVLKNLLSNRAHFEHKIIGIRLKNEGLISFGLFPYDNHSVYNIINASIRIQDDPILKTINLLMLNEAIKFALDSNRIFDFEGSMLPGVSDFYRLMGGIQTPVYRLTKSKNLKYSFMRALAQIRNDRK